MFRPSSKLLAKVCGISGAVRTFEEFHTGPPMTRPMTRPPVTMFVMMEDNELEDANAEEKSQAFVVRMWEEDPGEWRGTVRHVRSQVHLGFTRVDQVSRFIQQFTTGAEKRQSFQTPAIRSPFQFHLGASRRTTRLLATALALIVLSALVMLASGHGDLTQVLGFGH